MENRVEKFEKRRKELNKLSDQELKDKFWQLCDDAVSPMVELSKTHTSPSIERSVLMRMGVDTFTAKAAVINVVEAGLLGKGAGNCVLKRSQKDGIDVVAAAKKIADSSEHLNGLFS